MNPIKDRRLKRLLEILSQDQYTPALTLSNHLEVSSKTVRRMIKECNYSLKNHGAEIISKHGIGYKINITDLDKYRSLWDGLGLGKSDYCIPNSSEERIQFLLEYLLNNDEFVKLDDLSEQIYVSKNTLSSDLKKVEKMLHKYHLKITRKPNYGIALSGREFDLRLCIASLTTQRLLSLEDQQEQDDIRRISEIIIDCAGKRSFKVNEMAFQNLIIHIYVAMKRIDQNYEIPQKTEQQELVNSHEMEVAKDIVRSLEQSFGTSFSEGEVEYIAIHLASKQVYEFLGTAEQNMVIRQDVIDLVSEMLESVYDYFKRDFRDNLELRMTISQHLVPLLVRIEHDMVLKNPILEDIKTKYIFSYMMAAHASTVISKKYGKVLSEDEVGYIALPFALALERNKDNIVKKNVLFVCSSGKGSAELLVYKFKEEFGKYIDQITVCDLYKVADLDFKNIDYIFTTVPIPFKVPAPIMEVSFFWERKKIDAMKLFFLSGGSSSAESYFSEKLFFSNIVANDREQVIKELCEKTGEVVSLPEQFYEAVLTRENLAKTDFGNLVALPHPYKAMSKESFVSVGILEHPIKWTENQVQVVLLIAISEEDTNDIQTFYGTVIKLISEKQYIQKLISERSYLTLRELLIAAEREANLNG